VCHQHRYQPLLASLSLLGIVGLFAGIYQDAWKPLFYADTQVEATRTRLVGRLEAAHNATKDTVGALAIRLDFEQMAAEHQDVGDPIGFPSPPQLPVSLEKILHDGEAFNLLSDSMKGRLPYFVKVRKTFLHGFTLALQLGHAQPGSIKMMLEEYRTQEACIKLELRFQRGQLKREALESLFNSELRNHVVRVLGDEADTDDLPLDARFGDPEIMDVPK